MCRLQRVLLPLILLVVALVGQADHVWAQRPSTSRWQAARDDLVDQKLVPSGIQHQGVIEALRTTPRHEFVPLTQQKWAYLDMALPIGDQQTISSPFIVAFMTQSLDPRPTDRVLEIGTGSGYQAAILSPLVRDVFSIEIVPSLGKRASLTLKRLGYANVHVKIGDGYQGWPEEAPFDKIIVTCSPEDVPDPLVDQLAEGGSLVIPVGERYQQTLVRMTKRNGELHREPLRPTLFVPMTGTAESQRAIQPDLTKVAIKNGSFDAPSQPGSPLPGWYYQRQVARVASKDTTEAHAQFQNEIPGLASHALQGFAVDGVRFRSLHVSAKIAYQRVVPGPHEDMVPMIAVSFYDQDRSPLGQQWIGPWKGTAGWTSVRQSFRVPHRTREAILRIGLFGATGSFSVEGLEVTPQPR